MKVNHKGIHIDGIDKKILRALMEDARTPILEIEADYGNLFLDFLLVASILVGVFLLNKFCKDK